MTGPPAMTPEILVAGLRADLEALSKIGIIISPPWWRRHLQARLFPVAYRRWCQWEILGRLHGR